METRIVDLVIQGGRIVSGRHTTPPSWIAVDKGKIVALGTGQNPPRAKKTIDVTGKYVLPGCVEPEIHPIPTIEKHIPTETAAGVVRIALL